MAQLAAQGPWFKSRHSPWVAHSCLVIVHSQSRAERNEGTHNGTDHYGLLES